MKNNKRYTYIVKICLFKFNTDGAYSIQKSILCISTLSYTWTYSIPMRWNHKRLSYCKRVSLFLSVSLYFTIPPIGVAFTFFQSVESKMQLRRFNMRWWKNHMRTENDVSCFFPLCCVELEDSIAFKDFKDVPAF